jgi:hypothetical protein
MTAEIVRTIVGALLVDVQLRQAIPAVFARLDRCAPEDVTVLRDLVDRLAASGASAGAGADTRLSWSPVLHALVTRSEMWESPLPSYATLLAARADDLFYSTETELSWAMRDGAPTYPRDEHVGAFAETDVPMLLMNGSLDPQTSLRESWPAGMHFTGPRQAYAVIERAAHGVIVQSPYVIGDLSRTCGLDLMAQFVDDPGGGIDGTCVSRSTPIDFSDPATAMIVFGTSSIWDPVAPRAFVLGPREHAALERARRAIRRPFELRLP